MQNTFQLPVDLIIKLFNSLPHDSSLREEVIEYIRAYKKTVDRKGHKAEGFILKETGELFFDESLYDEAVYRGKIETYTRAASKEIEKVRSSLETLKTMGECHANALSSLSSDMIIRRVGEGEPISKEQMGLLEKLMPLLLNDKT